jgi:hypothetical protein
LGTVAVVLVARNSSRPSPGLTAAGTVTAWLRVLVLLDA